jgi:hypothetical protein
MVSLFSSTQFWLSSQPQAVAMISLSPFPTPNVLSVLVDVNVDSINSVSVPPTSTSKFDFVGIYVPPEVNHV